MGLVILKCSQNNIEKTSGSKTLIHIRQPMGFVENLLSLIQFFLFIPIFIVGLDYLSNIFARKKRISDVRGKSESQLLIIMAFRDEEKTLPQSLPPLVDYIFSSQNTRLILVDSASSDSSLSVVGRTLPVRGELNSKFSIKEAKQPGKCLALNLAMKSREKGE